MDAALHKLITAAARQQAAQQKKHIAEDLAALTGFLEESKRNKKKAEFEDMGFEFSRPKDKLKREKELEKVARATTAAAVESQKHSKQFNQQSKLLDDVAQQIAQLEESIRGTIIGPGPSAARDMPVADEMDEDGAHEHKDDDDADAGSLHDLTVAALREMARRKGMKDFYKLRKDDLVAAIKRHK